MQYLQFSIWQKDHPPALSRQRDYSPTTSSLGYKDPSGEASRHLDFIRNDVIPYIEQRFNTDAGRRTYMGNSFSGLFGIYIFLNQPAMFKNYIIGSPSIWWDKKYILQEKSPSEIIGAELKPFTCELNSIEICLHSKIELG